MITILHLLIEILSVIGSSSVAAAFLPQKKGVLLYDIIRFIIDHVAFNFFNAKNKEKK